MDLLLDRLPSPVGTIVLVCGGGVLRAVHFHGDEGWMRRWLRRQYGPYRLVPGRAPAAIRGRLEAYFEGDLEALDQVPVETAGTPFQQMVWSALRTIPVGTTVTYGQLAARIGKPGSSRAVGMANGSNPVPIVVPCHRVIGANGALTGYGGGLDRKRWLLTHERALPAGAELDLFLPLAVASPDGEAQPAVKIAQPRPVHDDVPDAELREVPDAPIEQREAKTPSTEA
jgi:methylated-DNA-[protein]-cysteine S-methyltransferase